MNDDSVDGLDSALWFESTMRNISSEMAPFERNRPHDTVRFTLRIGERGASS